MVGMGSISQYFFEELALFSCQIRVYVIFQYPFNYWYKLNHLSLAWTGEKLTNIAFDSCVICAWPSHCSTGRHFNSIFCLMRCTHYFDSNNRKSTQTCTLLYFTQFQLKSRSFAVFSTIRGRWVSTIALTWSQGRSPTRIRTGRPWRPQSEISIH